MRYVIVRFASWVTGEYINDFCERYSLRFVPRDVAPRPPLVDGVYWVFSAEKADLEEVIAALRQDTMIVSVEEYVQP